MTTGTTPGTTAKGTPKPRTGRVTRAFAAAAAAVLALTLTACGENGGGAQGGGPRIAIVSKGFQHQFWQSVKRGAEEEARERGADVTFVGRLARYQYLNMDQVVAQALATYRQLAERLKAA